MVRKYIRALVVGAGAAVALGMLTAPTGTAAPMPPSATYIADVPENDGATMTMAVTVDGEKVVAYATNGTNDEAYFFGTQKDGQMDLMSMYGDNLKASFDGATLNGEVTMNQTDAKPLNFAASSVVAPAGLYTAAHDTASPRRAASAIRVAACSRSSTCKPSARSMRTAKPCGRSP